MLQIDLETKLRDITLIGISGAARAGKDTIGGMLSKHLGYPTYALASPIKKHVNELCGWDERHSNGELKEIVDPYWGFSPRHAYQTFGTEWARNLLRDDFWLCAAERKYDENSGLIITDVRFENEAFFIRDNGGMIIHVSRESAEPVLSHASEMGIAKVNGDVLIYNNSSLDILEKEVQSLVNLMCQTEQ